jgi:hypothetical protein
MDHIRDSGRIEDVDDLQPPLSVTAADRFVFAAVDATTPAILHDPFRFTWIDTMPRDMFPVPLVPPKSRHCAYYYTTN